MKQTSKGANHSVFQPTFGNRPDQYIGRDGVIEQFMAGLQEPVGSRNRCTLFLGQRGMGKTALLLELSDRATRAGCCFHCKSAGGFGQERAGYPTLSQATT